MYIWREAELDWGDWGSPIVGPAAWGDYDLEETGSEVSEEEKSEIELDRSPRWVSWEDDELDFSRSRMETRVGVVQRQ